MFDVTFLIPDYADEEDGHDFIPPDPDSEMLESEKDRLFEELCAMIDSGAYDPDNEIIM